MPAGFEVPQDGFRFIDYINTVTTKMTNFRPVTIVVKNNSGADLHFIEAKHDFGRWEYTPPPVIPNGHCAVFGAQNRDFCCTGVSGICVYEGADFSLCVAFDNPYVGSLKTYAEVDERGRFSGADMDRFLRLVCEEGVVMPATTRSGSKYTVSCFTTLELTEQVFVVDRGHVSQKGASSSSSSTYTPSASKVADNSLYQVLGVGVKATPAEIKRAYYKRALESHPDKHPDDPTADAKFKRVSEAYEVLSNPEKREYYDKYGSSVAQDSGDARALFKSLFGDGQFDDCFGDIFSVLLAANPSFIGLSEERKKLKLEELQRERNIHLSGILRRKLNSFLDNQRLFEDEVKAEVAEKALTPGGDSLLTCVGYCYKHVAKQHLDRMFGLQALYEEKCAGFHTFGQTLSLLFSAAELENTTREETERLRFHHEQGLIDDEEKAKREEQLAKKLKEKSLRVCFQFGLLEVEQTCRQVAFLVLADKSIRLAVRKRMAVALERMGELYETAGKEAANASAAGRS
eukprot:TRINITY_DN21062_c0_g1_i1.p1 TRINITY_DN21062_c0_g1~~TRINITY_DN21062_c0_g1_i1.p1  ORF type:complete len:516 (+),score=102.15 TRINITY_DN21062_c0_g1_i1:101-1648(+)